MPWSDVGSALQCTLTESIQNWDQSRPYTACLTQRLEGFTEEWGSSTRNFPDDDDAETDDVSAQLLLQPLLRLHQYRPAWLEQLVLRVVGLPYRVHNSPYAVHELTGPLPFLQDLGSDDATATSLGATPAMVGREQQQQTDKETSFTFDNSILDYLKRYRSVDLDQALDDEQRQQSVLYTTLIEETLNKNCLYGLRYGDSNENHTWEQIYRPQCYRAACSSNRGTNSRSVWIVRPLASFQAWSERRYRLRRSGNIHYQLKSVDQLIAMARRAYQVLEHRLRQNTTYLLDTSVPTVVDCLLWDHLMQALTDVYLVVLLAEFPRLLQYTQHIWDLYHFGVAVDDNSTRRLRQKNKQQQQPQDNLSVWNWEENAINAFNEVPMLPVRLDDEVDDDVDDRHQKLQHAIDVMKKLSVHDLNATVRLVHQVRQNERQHPRRLFSTWHRWRMGGTWDERTDNGKRTRAASEPFNDSSNNKPHQQTAPSSPTKSSEAANNEQTMLREYQRNDELWLAGVMAATLAVVFGFGFAGGGSR